MTNENFSWNDYYQKIQGRKPRQLLLDALEKFPWQKGLYAIDLGCGDGTETVILLERGWNVLAVDGEPTAIKRLMGKVPAENQKQLETQVAKFQDVVLTPANLVHASLSIPFCEPEYFDELWRKIVNAVKPSGRFAGQFFGVRDSWVTNTTMTFHSEEQVRELLVDFEIESFHEMDEDGQAASGPKHWHVFTVIARKK
jgi:tellurite methyltransferase